MTFPAVFAVAVAFHYAPGNAARTRMKFRSNTVIRKSISWQTGWPRAALWAMLNVETEGAR
jgi:hypothetical protein